MHVGLCTLSDSESKVETVLSQAATAGYDGVEIWGDGHVDGTPHTVRDAAEEYGLEIPVYGSYLRPGSSAFLESYEHELSVADTLGASLIRVWAGEEEYGDHDADHWDHVVSDLGKLSSAASKLGLGVTVEKHEGTLTNDADGAYRLLEGVDEPNCGLNWQPLFEMNADAILDEARDLAPLSNNVHIQAVPESGESTRCALADAFFDVEGIVETFRTAEFDGYVNVEFVRSDVEYARAIEADLNYLRSLGV